MFKVLEEDQNLDNVSIVGQKDITDIEAINLKEAVIELTHRSPIFDRSSPIKQKVPEEKELSTEEILQIFDHLNEEGVQKVTLTGGEPTLRNDFRTIVEYGQTIFDQLIVHTKGTNDRDLTEYDITVMIDIDYPEPIDHNGIHRMTSPDRYEYDAKGGEVTVKTRGEDGEVVERTVDRPRIIPKKRTISKFSDKKLKTFRAATSHIARKHSEEAVQLFNKEHGTHHETWEDIKQDDRFSWSLFLEKPEPKLMQRYESQLQLAYEKAEKLPEDTPVIVKSKILSNNNLDQIIGLAQEIDADLVFKPVVPAEQSDIATQMPKPKRFKEAVMKVIKLDYQLTTNITIDHPIYKLFYKEKHMQDMTRSVDCNQLREWLKRGRVSKTGISKILITPDGTVMPSKHVRSEEYIYGNIAEEDIESIKQGMTEFNEKVFDEDKDLQPVGKDFGLRNRHIAADPDMYLNNAYRTPKNNTLKSKPLQINNMRGENILNGTYGKQQQEEG